MDEEACPQANTFGLVLVEGFFDVAKLVEAGCRNVGALMGSRISIEQIERLQWMYSRLGFPQIVLFLDRDHAGREGTRQAGERLRSHNFEVGVFDRDRGISWNGQDLEPIPLSIQDPADMSVQQLQSLRNQGII